MATKSKLIAGGDGTAIPAGYVGELLGSTTNTGTGGLSKSYQSTTALTTTNSSMVSATLNKGHYDVFCHGYVRKAATTNVDIIIGYLDIGGTVASGDFVSATQAISQGYLQYSFSVPIQITSDSTVVSVVARMGTENSTATAGHRMHIVRRA